MPFQLHKLYTSRIRWWDDCEYELEIVWKKADAVFYLTL